MAEMNIFFAADNGYSQHLGVIIASILDNSKQDEEFNFFILDGGISEENQIKINSLKNIKNFNIEFLKMNNDDFKNCPLPKQCAHISIATYYRFKIPRLKPNLDKILYLDCDMVVEQSLSELWNTDIENYYFAAARGNFEHFCRERLGLPMDQPHASCGMMLINCKKWREDNIESKLFEFVENHHEKIIWVDQDVINAVMTGKWKVVSMKWNALNIALFLDGACADKEDQLFAKKNPYIIHFAAQDKPWHPQSNYNFKSRYFKYLKLTPWKNFVYKATLEGTLYNIKSLFKHIIKQPFFLFRKKSWIACKNHCFKEYY